MKLAIMQPYLFPYIGYFQLINAVDMFVIYDDVNFIKGGWINRNYILTNADRQLFTLPLKAASQNKLINEIEVGESHKILKNLCQSYSKAPQFDEVYPILEDIFRQTEKNLAKFLSYQLRVVCDYLGLNPQWQISSMLDKDNALRGQDKILSICKKLKATHYINMPGGKTLYDQKYFTTAGLNLSFIHPKAISYRQFGSCFIPDLSIIDVIMFNDRETSSTLLKAYHCV